MGCEGLEWGRQEKTGKTTNSSLGANIYVFLETKIEGEVNNLLKEFWANG